jgi:hypothetical protein
VLLQCNFANSFPFHILRPIVFWKKVVLGRIPGGVVKSIGSNNQLVPAIQEKKKKKEETFSIRK